MNISIIIPAYNAEDTILSAINSVLNQTILQCLKYEIIIVNDGSIDNTQKILTEYKNNHPSVNLKVILQENQGVSSARNNGIKISQYEWIAFLDSDDIWLSNKLENQINMINKYNDVDFIGCARNNEDLAIFGKKIKSFYKANIHDLLIKMFPQTSTALVKKSLLLKVGLYDEMMSHGEDGDLWIRLCANGNFYYMPESLVITGGGKSNFGEKGLSANLKKMHLGYLKIILKCRGSNKINTTSYILYYLFYNLKYLRRLLITRLK